MQPHVTDKHSRELSTRTSPLPANTPNVYNLHQRCLDVGHLSGACLPPLASTAGAGDARPAGDWAPPTRDSSPSSTLASGRLAPDPDRRRYRSSSCINVGTHTFTPSVGDSLCATVADIDDDLHIITYKAYAFSTREFAGPSVICCMKGTKFRI